MVYDVIRTFGIDYIFFDLIFVALFLFLLIKFKKKIPLLVFFIGGLGINFLMDWGIWLHTGIREISLPANFFGGIFLFFLWFSLSYGVEYAYVFLMFEKKSNKLGWTLLVFGGWLLVAFLSQFFSVNDALITTVRHMGDLRFLRIILVLVGYSLLFIFRYDWKKISYLFFIGFLIHFMMEFSLFVSGIRPGSFPILLENSLIEFNMGIPFFYLLYDKFLKKKIK
jgi:hypothetical protein